MSYSSNSYTSGLLFSCDNDVDNNSLRMSQIFIIVSVTAASDIVNACCQTLYDQQMVEFALKVTIVIFITEIIIAPVKIFTEAAASVASTVATALCWLVISPFCDFCSFRCVTRR